MPFVPRFVRAGVPYRKKHGIAFLFFHVDLIHQKFRGLFPKVGRHIEAIGLGSHALAKLPYSGLTSKRTRAIVIDCGWFGPREVIVKLALKYRNFVVSVEII
jgi:hypothetical protein